MKMLLAANWKSHKTIAQTTDFFTAFAQEYKPNNVEVLICPSYSSLTAAQKQISDHNLSVGLGAQNVSQFEEGAYTGEVSAIQLRELVEYVVIGHSERRNLFHETEEEIEKKVSLAVEAGIKVILCVQNELGIVYSGVDTVAFEPVGAIGSGHPDSPEDVTRVLGILHQNYPQVRLLYGGSVDIESISKYSGIPNLSGFLVGGASLDAKSFATLISLCDTPN
jgi:triosephosphate isomerase